MDAEYKNLNYRVLEIIVDTLSVLIPIFGLILIYVIYLAVNKYAGIKCVQCGLHDLMSHKSLVGSIVFAIITQRLTKQGIMNKVNPDPK